MPELPDIEVARALVQRHALRREIAEVRAGRTRLLARTPLKTLRATVVGHAIARAHRHGKHLLLTLAGDGVLGVHFGLVGQLAVGDGEPPEKARVALVFDDGSHLAVIDPRQFGRLALADDRAAYVTEHGLGPDALDVGTTAFVAALADRRAALKPTLMDQALIAGIGNVYADEICFHARLHPQRRVDTLSADEVADLHRRVHRVLTTAIRRGADRDAMPRGWLMGARRGGADCPRCDGRIVAASVAGRTTCWCPTCQPAR